MAEPTIECPKCNTKIPLSEAISKDLEAQIKTKFEIEIKQTEKRLQAENKEALEKLKSQQAQQASNLEKKIREEIEEKNSIELEDLKSSLKTVNESLELAQGNELQLRQQKRDLEQREKNLKLEVERTLDRERSSIAEKASQEVEASHRLRDQEKDSKLEKALEQLEEMKRKLEQGSQQAQGEALELELETALKTQFTDDLISEVAKGVKGGDIVQWVRLRNGTDCGSILWELKRTKSFSDSWIAKLKADARNCKADICLLVTETMPEDIKSFGEINGVWVCTIASAIALACVLREVLIRVTKEKGVQTGKKEKAELVYDYLTGTQFKGRMEAIVEVFKLMKEDLETERRAFEKIWGKRDKQIGQVLLNLAGMHGDLSGLAGNELPSITLLELTGGKSGDR